MDAKEELELLDRVFLRVVAVETDSQLEACLGKFLSPTLLKIASPHQAVRGKVMELLTHVNKRVRDRPSVHLPLFPLLQLVRDSAHPPAVTNFCLVYLKLGLPRISAADKGGMVPSLLEALPGRSPQQQHSIVQLIVSALPHLVIPGSLEERRSLLSLAQGSAERAGLLEDLRTHLLLPYGSVDLDSLTTPAPPGLSKALVAMATGGSPLPPDSLEKVKLAILRLLACEVFSADEVVVHFIIAAGDNRHSVSDAGDTHLRQFASSANWEDPSLVEQLYSLYQGSENPAKKQKKPTAVRDRVSPAALRVKFRLLPYLTRSALAASCFPSNVQVVFDGLFGGVTNPRLRTMALQFIQHICSRASEAGITLVAPVLLTGLNKIFDQPNEPSELVGLAYGALGKLAKRCPALFAKDVKQLSKLFSAVKMGLPSDVSLAIQECVGVVGVAYRGVTGDKSLLVEAILLENIRSEVPQCRLMAVKCAGAIFPFSHIPSRFICILATGDSKEDVREAGRRGLLPWEQDELPQEWSQYPDFIQAVSYITRRARVVGEAGGGYSTAAGSLPFPPAALTQAISFLQSTLHHSADGAGSGTGAADYSVVRSYLSSVHHESAGCLEDLVDLLTTALGPAGDSGLYDAALGSLVELLGCGPRELATPFISRTSWIRGFTQSSRHVTRDSASQLLGLLAESLTAEQVTCLSQDLLKDANSKVFLVQLGALAAIGHVTAHMISQRAGLMDDLVQQSLTTLGGVVSECKTPGLPLTAVLSLGVIFSSGPLPLTADQLRELVGTLIDKLNSDNNSKVKEACALTLGQLSVGDPASPHKRLVIEALFSTRETKGIDLHFSIGEAIATAAAGGHCSLPRAQWSREATPTSRVSDDTLDWALREILDHYTDKVSLLVRQAAVIWLLSIVRHASSHPALPNYLQRIQATFINCLAERNDVTQEVASRGVGLVYEMSPPTQREALVQLLVGTLLEGRKRPAEVTGDTEVFQEGALGKTPTGGGVSTYRELCSLASDLNQPDLVYKFMHLSNHHALWNSKKGAAFGFSSIAATARAQLSEYLPAIVPRLYRYRFDPSPSVQLAMSNIWSSLVPDGGKTVEKYLAEILKELKSNLNSPQWRNRESSCSALADLLSSRSADQLLSHLPELWTLCLRVRDDIKESVRLAAMNSCKALHRITVRACDGATMSATGARVIESILPLLMEGMSNPSQEVRAVSLVTILKISRNAGRLLKPHVAVLVPSLLEALSSLEPQALNMYSLQLSETGVQDVLDSVRVSATRDSPMNEIINLCVEQVDSDLLPELVPRLTEIIKRGVGLGTKVTSAEVVVSLVRQCGLDLTPSAGKLLSALLTGLADRNSTVRKAYAKAIGHIVKVAKDASVVKMMGKLKTWYFDKDDPDIHMAVAMAIHSITTHSHDAAANHIADILPLVFIAKHSSPAKEDKPGVECLRLWAESWAELVPSETTALRLHLAELVGMADSALSAQQWRIRALGAAAMATIAKISGSELDSAHLSMMTVSLVAAAGGRVWEGKTSVLLAIRAMAKCPSLCEGDRIKIVEAVLGQCKKQDLAYKSVAMETAGVVLKELGIDRFSNLLTLVMPLLDQEAATQDDDDEPRRGGAREELREKCYDALGSAWPQSPVTQRLHYTAVCGRLSHALTGSPWKIQTAILTALQAMHNRLSVDLSDADKAFLHGNTIPSLCSCIEGSKFTAVRHASLLALDAITQRLDKELPFVVRKLLRSALGSLRDHADQALANEILTRTSS